MKNKNHFPFFIITIILFSNYSPALAQYRGSFDPVKDLVQRQEDGEFDNWEMFDLNLNLYNRFPFFRKDGHAFAVPFSEKDLNPIGGNMYMPHINKNGESATIHFLDKDLQILGKNIYMPYLTELQRSYIFFPKTYTFDPKVNFKSEFVPLYNFVFYDNNNLKLPGTRGPFTNGVIRLKNSFLSLNGKEILKDVPSIEYKQHTPTNGFILVKNISVEGQNKTSHGYNFMDMNGKLLLSENVYFAKAFSEGLAEVCIKEDKNISGSYKKCGYINTKGEFQIPIKFSETESFKYGMAEVEEIISVNTKTDWKGVLNYVPGVETKKTTISKEKYYINEKGEKIISLHEDFQAFPLENWFVYHEILMTKNKTSKSIFSNANPTPPTVSGHEIGILTKYGVKLMKFNFGDIEIYQGDPNDNILLIKDLKNKKAVILNERNEINEIPTYNFFNGFHNGMALVLKDLKFSCGLLYKKDEIRKRSFCPDQEGFINLKGELQIPFSFRHVSNFAKERALVMLNDGSNALIDKQGKILKGSEILNSK